MIKIALLISMLLINSSLFAEEIYIANGNVNLRKDYPKFPFYQNAQIVGIVKKSDKVVILEEKNVFSYHWLKIKIISSSKIGWAYNGEIGDKTYFNKQEAN